MNNYVDIVFDQVAVDGAPPEYSFIEVEDSEGKSVAFGTWVHRTDGYWVLRITVTGERTVNENFGQRLTRICVERKLTKAELARMLKVNSTNVVRWARGEFYPDYWSLVELSVKLDLSLDYI